MTQPPPGSGALWYEITAQTPPSLVEEVSALMLGGVDYDEDPQLTLAVILPSVIVLLSAVAHLRSTNKTQRILSLLLGLLVAVAVSALRHWFYLLYGAFLVGIVFLPALLESLRPQSKTMQAE